MSILNDNAIKGAITQSKVEIRACEKGYIASKPILEQTRYDLIIDDGTKLLKIQVKYARAKQSGSSGSAVVDFRKTTNNGKCNDGYYKNEIDAVIVYLPQIEKLCFFPIEMIEGKTTLTIRYEKTKSGQCKNIIFADDYLW